MSDLYTRIISNVRNDIPLAIAIDEDGDLKLSTEWDDIIIDANMIDEVITAMKLAKDKGNKVCAHNLQHRICTLRAKREVIISDSVDAVKAVDAEIEQANTELAKLIV